MNETPKPQFTDERAQEVANSYIDMWQRDYGVVFDKVQTGLPDLSRTEVMLFFLVVGIERTWAALMEGAKHSESLLPKQEKMLDLCLEEMKEDKWKE